MKRFLKWFLIVGAAAVVLVASSILLIPLFFDAEDLKPQIQSALSSAAGRPIRLEGDIALSIFPWTGFTISGFQMMNPPGFSEPRFLTVESFDLKVALVPLFSKDIQVRHVRLTSPRIVLETTKEGRTNWADLGRSPNGGAKPETAPAPSEGGSPLPVKAFRVDEITVSNGQVLWIDHSASVRKTLSDVDLNLKNISLTSPIQLAFSARLDGDPFSIQGSVGPVGNPPGAGTLNLDLTASALELLTVHLKGAVDTPAAAPSFQASIDVAPFSPKKLAGRLGQPLETTDPNALEKMAFKGKISGNPSSATLSDGQLALDDSTVDVSLSVKRFERPDVQFDLSLDAVNVDRYLPPPGGKASGTETQPRSSSSTPSDRKALRSLLLSGTVQVGRLMVSGGTLQDIRMTVSAKDGVFTVDPLGLSLYDGSLRGTVVADLSGSSPGYRVHGDLEKVDVASLLTDFADKDILGGTGSGAIELQTAGENPDALKRHLNGKGSLLFTDGAIKGVDLTRIAQNAKTLLTLEKQPPLEGRTDFSEFKSNFTINDGIVAVSEARLTAPAMRLNGRGQADLVNETLDFRAEPKLVASLKGKGDETDRAGFGIPLLITGSFDDPKIRPDPAALLQQIENLPASISEGKEKISEQLEEQKAAVKKRLEEKKGQLDAILGGKKSDQDEKDGGSSKKQNASDFLKKLPFGQ